ncbi:MAG: hypothetical protein AB7E77_04720 [Desulfobulbus sp.]
MKPSASPRRLLIILLFPLLLWSPLLAADEGINQAAEAPRDQQIEQPANPAADEQEAEDLQALRQRYGQDRTGVRARLGMCRRGHGGGRWKGQGGGYGRGQGQGRGPMHGPRHPCPYGEPQWNSQP